MNTLKKDRTKGFLRKEKVTLNIPGAVYDKIKYLCTNISQVEWSGVLFYKIKGELSSGKCKIELKDILPLDKGTGTFTSFTSDERFAEFMMAKVEEYGEDVMTWSQGLIHSHNNMAVFFSGTDQDELLSDCKNYNQYLSLICNNKLEFVAKVAQYGKATVTKENVPVYGLSTKGNKQVIAKEKVEAVKETILVYDCDIKVPKGSKTIDDTFLSFFNKIMKKPVKTTTSYTPRSFGAHQKSSQPKSNPSTSWGSYRGSHKSSYPVNEKFFGEDKFYVDPRKEVFAECSNISEYIRDWEDTDDRELLNLTEEILSEFQCELETTSKDFVATLINKCQKENLDFVKEATSLENYINENCDIGTTYISQMSRTLAGTINNIQKQKVNG